MIGEQEVDAGFRLRCYELAVNMAGVDKHNTDTVDKIATSVYAFVASGGDPKRKTLTLNGRDKLKSPQ